MHETHDSAGSQLREQENTGSQEQSKKRGKHQSARSKNYLSFLEQIKARQKRSPFTVCEIGRGSLDQTVTASSTAETRDSRRPQGVKSLPLGQQCILDSRSYQNFLKVKLADAAPVIHAQVMY